MFTSISGHVWFVLLIEWLISWSIGLSIDRSIDWLISWSIELLNEWWDWLIDWFVYFSYLDFLWCFMASENRFAFCKVASTAGFLTSLFFSFFSRQVWYCERLALPQNFTGLLIEEEGSKVLSQLVRDSSLLRNFSSSFDKSSGQSSPFFLFCVFCRAILHHWHQRAVLCQFPVGGTILTWKATQTVLFRCIFVSGNVC